MSSAAVGDVMGSAAVGDVMGCAAVGDVMGSTAVEDVMSSATVGDINGRAVLRQVMSCNTIRNSLCCRPPGCGSAIPLGSTKDPRHGLVAAAGSPVRRCPVPFSSRDPFQRVQGRSHPLLPFTPTFLRYRLVVGWVRLLS